MTIFQISSIKLIYISNNDYSKLEEIQKFRDFEKILNLKNISEESESQIIALIKYVQLKENEENKIINELQTKKNIFEKNINDYIFKKDNKKVLCEILPSYELAINEVGNYPAYYKSQIKNLVFSI